jgi:hypothetical protein
LFLNIVYFFDKIDMKKGFKLKCNEDINNLLGSPLFKKDEVYEVLYINNESTEILVCLNHILYANEYNSFSLEWVNKKFKIVK